MALWLVGMLAAPAPAPAQVHGIKARPRLGPRDLGRQLAEAVDLGDTYPGPAGPQRCGVCRASLRRRWTQGRIRFAAGRLPDGRWQATNYADVRRATWRCLMRRRPKNCGNEVTHKHCAG